MGRRPCCRRHGQRTRKPLFQPHDDQRSGARQRVRHQGLGYPLQDGAAGAYRRAGPGSAAPQPHRAAAPQPSAAAPSTGERRSGLMQPLVRSPLIGSGAQAKDFHIIGYPRIFLDTDAGN